MHRFETHAPPRLRVRTPAGVVTVDATETQETTVELEALRDDEVSRAAVHRATVEQRGDEILVEVEKTGGGFFSRSPSVGVRIRCPHGSSLDCNTASADVTATGRLGDVQVKTASGDVDLAEVGTLGLNTASGDVRVRELQGGGRISTVSGDVRVGGVRGELSVNSVSGDVDLGHVDDRVTVQSVSGDQRLAAVRATEARLQSVSGDLQVGVAQGQKLFIDATSTSGDVRSELEVGDSPTGGDDEPEARLHLRSLSGDILVARALATSFA